MSRSEFKPPRQTPSQRGHLERLAGDYGRAEDGARFLVKGSASMELRLGLGARTTKDIDRETGSRRLFVQVSFGGKDWQTLQVEVARPEATEPAAPARAPRARISSGFEKRASRSSPDGIFIPGRPSSVSSDAARVLTAQFLKARPNYPNC